MGKQVQTTWQCRNSKKKDGSHSGRKTKRTEDTLAQVSASIDADPTMSVRRCAQELCVLKTLLHVMLTKDLKLKPYLISIHHSLTEADMETRVAMANWFLDYP